MVTDHRSRLREIRTFRQLVAYLRDEMGWPIGSDDFEELTFDYTPEELGIDAKNAAKIQEIKRLRPLAPSQPWGIFFVKFEPKCLPVVALRRILGQVALKKRASANSAERRAWAADDLLFVSNYGEGDERRISFAHFSKAQDGRDLPTLKVLGWDNLDTPLHLDDVAEKLTHHLAWPSEDAHVEAWRERWRAAFILRHREVITTSRDLSLRLAELARAIRDRIRTALAIETETGPLTRLMKAFQEALVHDLDSDGFADMYAQTIAYGLLSARIADPEKRTADDFAAHMRTNPFLKELMETFLRAGGRRGRAGGPGIDFDELGVSEVVELLDDANMEAILDDFGRLRQQEDPVTHFYELFLNEFDQEERKRRGIYYTPRPVVSYIVRSVDELLRTEFSLEDGLADTITWGEIATRHEGLTIPDGVSPDQAFVQVLDPATGTGTFLVEIIDLIHKTMVRKWKAQGHRENVQALWNEYVPKHLLPRLHGYELLMAPYTIAHLKIGLKLYETGYRFGSDERARVYLTNALESASDSTKQMEFKEWVPALAHEALAVGEIKRSHLFTVLVGNPPYSLMSANLGEEQRRLIDAYRFVDGLKIKERGALQLEKNLQDDYVKFIRLAEIACERSPLSVMGFITNHAYIENPTLRGLRRSLMGTFSSVWVLDLHGNLKRKERCPLPVQDQNVFDIQQGVAIALLARRHGATEAKICWGELWGSRDDKYVTLGENSFRSLSAIPVSAAPELYLFLAQDDKLRMEFDGGLPLDRVFSVYSTGVATARDSLTVHFTRMDLRATIHEFSALQAEQARKRFGLGSDTNDWKVALALSDLKRSECNTRNERAYQYRPFDRRYTYYTGQPRGFLCNPRWPVMRHLIAGRNAALCSVKSVETGDDYAHVFVTSVLADHHSVSLKEVNYVFPSLTYLNDVNVSEQRGLFHHANSTPIPNFTPEFLSLLKERLGFGLAGESRGAGTIIDAHDLLAYVYCVLHSATFRKRYAGFLRKEFARIPVPKNCAFFKVLVKLGGKLVALHLMESPKLGHFITTYAGPKNPEVGRIGWSHDIVWLDAGKTSAREGHFATVSGTIGFKGVPKEVWEFHVGGYQVCHKWLSDRKGRSLSADDMTHYQKIVVALHETTRLMKEIDAVIEKHGGWPAAFQTGESKTINTETSTIQANNVTPWSRSHPTPTAYQTELLPLPKVAEPEVPADGVSEAATEGTPRRSVDEIDREDLVCRIRQLFSDGEERERESAIDALAHELGYQRTGTRIHEDLENALRTAVRRGILGSSGKALRSAGRSIEQYERDFLKDQFLASLAGHQWTEREDAIRGFARWLGFRRTGQAIDERARSLINGLIREGRIESDGSLIRRT